MLNLRCSWAINADVVMTTTRCFLGFDGRGRGIHRRMLRLLTDQGKVLGRRHDNSSKTVGSGEQRAKLRSGNSRGVAFLYLYKSLKPIRSTWVDYMAAMHCYFKF